MNLSIVNWLLFIIFKYIINIFLTTYISNPSHFITRGVPKMHIYEIPIKKVACWFYTQKIKKKWASKLAAWLIYCVYSDHCKLLSFHFCLCFWSIAALSASYFASFSLSLFSPVWPLREREGDEFAATKLSSNAWRRRSSC